MFCNVGIVLTGGAIWVFCNVGVVLTVGVILVFSCGYCDDWGCNVGVL